MASQSLFIVTLVLVHTLECHSFELYRFRLQSIDSAAREQIQKLIEGKVYLELFVKVQPKWWQSRTRLAELGDRLEE